MQTNRRLPSFEDVYPKHEFAPLVDLALALAKRLKLLPWPVHHPVHGDVNGTRAGLHRH